ncbi:MAG: DUF4386 family protein [Promethearchaeota archaeon]
MFIIVTNVLSNYFGYKTFGDVDLEDQLHKINSDPKKFKISFALILLEHLGIISLAITMFIAFSPYCIILGIIWLITRLGEALIQIYDKKSYWGLLNIAVKYSDKNASEKSALFDLGSSILKRKEFRFGMAQILFSIGTFAYSLLFVSYGVVSIIIGWFGIIASILYGLGNGIFQINSNIKVLWNIGGGLILLFELVLGGWLLFF